MRHRPTRRVAPPLHAHRRPHHGRGVDPVLTRKGALSHPGRIIFALGGLLFGAYIFNIGGTQVTLDAFFRDLEHTIHRYDRSVSNGFLASLPLIGVLLAVLAFFLLFSGMRRGATVVSKARTLKGREELTVHQFVAMAKDEGIGTKVAREAYRLLLPHYKERMRALPTDRLAADLRMTPAAIHDLHANLLRMTDRQRNLREGASLPVTVFDLMLAVDRLEDRSLTVSKANRRAEAPVVVPEVKQRARDQSFIRPARLPQPEVKSTQTGTDG